MEAQMAAARPSPQQQQKAENLARTVTKLLRRKRADAAAAGVPEAPASVAGDEHDGSMDTSISSLSKLKLSGNLAAAYSLDAFFRNAAEKKAAAANGTHPSPPLTPDAATDSLLANLFAGVSAVKAAYAQLQLAQFPYDAEAIQSADAAVVAELTRLSDTKRRYLKDPAAEAKNAAAAGHTALAAHAEEQRHLLKTYQITARKLEAELRAKDAELDRAKGSLAAELRAERALEARLHPGRTLASLDELHVSGLNPTHFLTALRHTVKSIRSFSKSMLNSMQSAGWNLASAAAAVHPGVPLRRSRDTKFVLESYVAMKMFANFHRRDFNFSFLDEGEFYDRRRFFDEFMELKAAPASVFLDVRNARWGGFGKFLRAKYLSLVHARMETAFFGRLEQRGIVSAGPGFPESSWFAEFAEMARRVWLLHCLFFAFDGGAEEDGASIFQVRTGVRFSEVYMESVNDGRSEDAAAAAEDRVVGFTVVPGFRIGRTMIQCRVYLSRPGRPSEVPRTELQKELRIWAVSSISVFQNQQFFGVLLNMLVNPLLPVYSLLSAADEILVREILYDALILVDYSFINKGAEVDQADSSLLPIFVSRLIITHNAINDARSKGDQGRAMSFINAFSTSNIPSYLSKWAAHQAGFNQLSKPTAITPHALLEWLVDLEDKGLKVFVDNSSRIREMLMYDVVKNGYQSKMTYSDTDLFFIDKQSGGEGMDTKAGEDEAAVEMETADNAFMAAAQSMKVMTNGIRKRKDCGNEEATVAKFVKYKVEDSSANDYFLSVTNGMSGGSEVENLQSDDEMVETD